MANSKETEERRLCRRYKAVEGAYAAISPNSHKLGQIADISISGLCFSYIDTSDSYQDAHPQPEELVFLSSMGYYVGDLPVKTVSDYEVTNVSSFSSLKIRRRHIHFTDLSSKQLFDLDNYLRHNVSEPMEEFSLHAS